MTTSSAPTPLVSGRDLLLALKLPVEGPILWGRPAPGGGPGVFIVELPAPAAKVSIDANAIREWLNHAPDLRLDGKRPSVAEIQSRLATFWVASQAILYIGSSQKSVGARLAGMYKTPLGKRRPQPAGYWLKTLKDLGKARIWWSPTSDPELYEEQLLLAFMKATNAMPYAIHTTPNGERRNHGITNPLHDDEPHKPVKITKVTVLPDAGAAEMALSSAPVGARPAAPAKAPAKPRAPRKASTPRKVAVKPAATVGPSAIETPVVRRQSKAVVAAQAQAAAVAAAAALPTHLTAEGLAALHAELHELTALRRPEVIARIKAARELGDLRENADYESARKEQSFLEGRVQQLQQMIKSAVIIEHGAESGSEVVLGSTVVVETDRHGEETFMIVGSAEADARSGKISYTSPIGRALMGRHPGETIRVQVPAGWMDFKVTDVR